MSLRYELAVLTHGRSAPLADTLWSFREHVRPLPDRIRLFVDAAPDASEALAAVADSFADLDAPYVSTAHPSRQAGFCSATRRLWDAASRDGGIDYVFWLEHDFLVERPVSLEQVASLLEQEPTLAQVALLRQACNPQEIAAGGVVPSRPGAFALRRSSVPSEGASLIVSWLEHRSFLTTNPSLMRQDFMLENPWPAYAEGCEGRFGIDLIAKGFSFGYWGDGETYVRHVGERDGRGY